MTRGQLIDKLAIGCSYEEGWWVTQQEARTRGIKWPTRAQRQCNPGNVRKWQGVPRTDGYCDFRRWAAARGLVGAEAHSAAVAEGWRVLKVLIGTYIDGRYHGGKSPTLLDMVRTYAPAGDGNEPERYARSLARRTQLPMDVPLAELIEREAA